MQTVVANALFQYTNALKFVLDKSENLTLLIVEPNINQKMSSGDIIDRFAKGRRKKSIQIIIEFLK